MKTTATHYRDDDDGGRNEQQIADLACLLAHITN
jgi:hypothetical protein